VAAKAASIDVAAFGETVDIREIFANSAKR
jgi:hypothetical protein